MNNIKRLAYLSSMLSKYAHRWCLGENRMASSRMYAWVDEYNDIKARDPEAWATYCAQRGFDPSCDAYDCMA